MKDISRVWFVLLFAAALVLCGCARQQAMIPSGSQRTATLASGGVESPAAAARRLLPEAVSMAEGSPDASALAGSTVATAEPVIRGYYGGLFGIAVPWVVTKDKTALKTDLFDQMRPSVGATDSYIVTVRAGGSARFEFEMQETAGRWQLVATSDSIDSPDSPLLKRLGPGTEVRRALLLPSGLVFDVGRNGSREALLMVAFFNDGPGINGFDGYLPWNKVLMPAQLRALLVDERTTPYSLQPGSHD